MNNKGLLSQEERILFNPAYCGLILYEVIRQFQGNDDEGMPCALAFLALPMSTNRHILLCLPKSVATPISGWVASNEGELVGLAATVSSFFDMTIVAISFLLDQGVVALKSNGRLIIEGPSIPKTPGFVNENLEIKQSFRAAGLIGRWFSSASSVESIYTQLGVRP